MHLIRAFVLAVAGAALPALVAAAPGFVSLKDSTLPERPLSLSVWYPSDNAAGTSSGTGKVIGGNAVFEGAAAVDAPLPDGPLPLILLSHGGLRSAANSGAWLAATLAAAGAVVVEINAPRPKTGAAASQEIWQRPRDISRALDQVLGSADWQGRIDRTHISVVGFALGGTAALMVSGDPIDVDRYAQSCAKGPGGGPDCGWFAAQGVDLASVDLSPLKQPLGDARIGSAVAIAPEYLADFDGAKAEPGARVLVIPLGGTPAGGAAIPGSSMSDAFATCTPAGPGILREDGGDDGICGNGPAERLAVHKAIAAKIMQFLTIG